MTTSAIKRGALIGAAQTGDPAAIDDDLAEQLLARRTDSDLRIDLAAALESLPAHYLEVVLLRDFEELTIGEIALRLREEEGAVNGRLHRARELVREYLTGSPAA